MSYLEIDGHRHPIPAGEVAVGFDALDQIALGGEEVQSKGAILQGLPDGQVAIRRADSDAEILVNGVRLGPQPTPLLHGDKIGIAGRELLFVDDRRSGSTSFIQAIDPGVGKPSVSKHTAGQATAGTGGRLVSLTDGREYVVEGGSLLIGRDAGCDVVIDSKSVSRRHAEIVATPKGYLLIDSSTNGTILNGEKVPGQHMLARADVIRCGDYEFRFYADALQPSQPAPIEDGLLEEDQESAAEPDPGPRLGAEQQLQHTLHGIPAVPRPKPAGTAESPPASKGASSARPPKKGPLAALRSIRERVKPTRPKPPSPPPPAGAESRLANTMHGIPITPRPDQGQPPGAASRLQDTMHGAPTADSTTSTPPGAGSVLPAQGEKERSREAPAAPDAPLATFVVRAGPSKGQRLIVRFPVVNIGRADYNDIVLPDESVSTVHAKLQRREGIWVLVDQGSTNGTIVDGKQVSEETALAPGAIVRFGAVQTVFEPTDDSTEVHKGSATKVIQPIHLPPLAGPRRSDPSPSD
jgi:pSer/pThr/pTyr-binding forkhead associated (FHA) protein